MLKYWQTHAEYQQFISDAVSHLNDSQRKKTGSYSYSIAKLSDLNLDPARDFMLPYYKSFYIHQCHGQPVGKGGYPNQV